MMFLSSGVVWKHCQLVQNDNYQTVRKYHEKGRRQLVKKTLRYGNKECKGDDLLTECKILLMELGKKDVTTGFFLKETIQQAILK